MRQTLASLPHTSDNTVTDPWQLSPEQDFTMPRGLPRPLWQGQPVPYTSEHHKESDGSVEIALAIVNPERIRECNGQSLCLLCGEELSRRAAVIVIYEDDAIKRDAPRRPQDRVVLEAGGFHERCARISMAHCPHLRDDPDNHRPEIWVGATAKLRSSNQLPEGWRRLKPLARRASTARIAVSA